MTTCPPYTGLYINLDRSVERRKKIEDQLRSFDLASRYERFAAVDARDFTQASAMRPAEIACFHSHYRALAHGRRSGLPVHIMEDDILLSEHLIDAAGALFSLKLFDHYDVICTETFVNTDPRDLGLYKLAFDHALKRGEKFAEFSVIDLSQTNIAGMTSYFVSPRSIDKVIGIYEEEIKKGPRMPVDICLRLAPQENRIRIGCWFPFVTTLRLEDVVASTIPGREGQENNPRVMMLALLRYSFFINRDLEGYAKGFLDAMIGDESAKARDVHREFLLKLLEFGLSGRCRSF